MTLELKIMSAMKLLVNVTARNTQLVYNAINAWKIIGIFQVGKVAKIAIAIMQDLNLAM